MCTSSTPSGIVYVYTHIPTRKGQGLPYAQLYPHKKAWWYVTASFWQNFHTFIHKLTVLRSKHWLYHAVFLLMISAIAQHFRFQLTGRGHPKNAPLLRLDTKAYNLHVFLCPFIHPKEFKAFKHRAWKNVSGYVCNHGSPSGERDTASPRGRYGECR